MTALRIFTGIALAGCAFMLYFLYSLWSDSRSPRKEPAEIKGLPTLKRDTGKLLRFYAAEEAREQKRL